MHNLRCLSAHRQACAATRRSPIGLARTNPTGETCSSRRRSSLRTSVGIVAMLTIAVAGLSGCARGDGTDRREVTGGDPPSRVAAENWNFESGDFAGWRTLAFGSGAWHVYEDGTTPPDPADSDPRIVFKVPAPPEGNAAAVTDMHDAGTRILHRMLKLDGRFMLRLTIFYEGSAKFFSPPSLDFSLAEPNQQFRIELIDPTVPVTSMARKHVLATIFRTSPGDPETLRPHEVTADLSRWAGQTVRLRLAQVDNRGPLRAGVDNLRLVEIPAVGSGNMTESGREHG